ncbi:MAG: hypothetical protein RL385_6019 [Pseudomonadota bacterium]|jgi:dihydrofolate reductase
MPVQLVYHVAISLDGAIAHADGTFDGFQLSGTHADAFLAAVQRYSAVLMGRKTYESGLAAGLPLGRPAYPGRPNIVFSRTLKLPHDHSPELSLVSADALRHVSELKQQRSGVLWLCGGGELAGQLIEANMVDTLLLKVNPVLLGRGRPLAAGLTRHHAFRFADAHSYDSGVVELRYERTP